MCKVIKFTRSFTMPEDRVMTVAARLGQGPKAPADVSLAAITAWDKANHVEHAAIHILTLPTKNHATDWWIGHIDRFAAKLASRGIAPDRINVLRAEYTQAVREEIKRIKSLRTTDYHWAVIATNLIFSDFDADEKHVDMGQR